MALSYMTNFSSLLTDQAPSYDWLYSRLDGADWHDEFHHVNNWNGFLGSRFYSRFLPYLVVSNYWKQVPSSVGHFGSFEDGVLLEAVRQNGANMADIHLNRDDVRVCVPPSKKMCVGVCMHFMFSNDFHSSYSDHRLAGLRFVFQAAQNLQDFSSGPKTNFTVDFSWSSPQARFLHGQSVLISFWTGGSDKPPIPGATVYYDFNQPLWFWVECDMLSHSPGSDAPVGNCRVWLNNDLVCSRPGILTADTSTWSASPWHAWNSICNVKSSFTAYSRNMTRRLHGIIVTDDRLSFMDSALGDVAISSPRILAPSQAQFTPHHAGVDLDIKSSDVLNTRMAATLSAELYGQRHLRGTEHQARDLFVHDHPFPADSHIFCVQQSITHRKHVVDGDTSKYRIEPTTEYSGRPVSMHRSLGQRSISQSLSTPNSLTVATAPHTIPYPGAFWTEEILRHAKFGYTCYDPANPALVSSDLDFLGEYDVENVDEELGLESEVVDSEEE